MPKKLTYEEVKRFIEKDSNSGCVLLSKEYKTANDKLTLLCECGEEFRLTFSSFKYMGKRQCNKCGYRITGIKKSKDKNKFAKEVYDLVKNEYFFLEEYVNSRTKIVCRHNKCGYEWLITPNAFFSGHRCPKCAGNLKKTNEIFLKEVFDLVGDEYIFLDKYKNAIKKIKCKHNKCGYEWDVSPSNFLRGSRCPDCNSNKNKFGFSHEEVKQYVEIKSNSGCKLLSKEYIDIEQSLKIKCKCGNIFETTFSQFRHKSKQQCNKCGFSNLGDSTRKTDEAFKNEVYNLTNGKYVFLEKYINSRTKIECIHNACGHKWKISPNCFLKGGRCPKCTESKGEALVRSCLEEIGVEFTDEYSFLDLFGDGGGLLKLDFCIHLPDQAVLLIEYDGIQHFEPIEFFGGKEGFAYRKKNDKLKNEYCKNKNIPLLRISHLDFDKTKEIVRDFLRDYIKL